MTNTPSQPVETNLAEQMRSLAKGGHERADELREKAAALDMAWNAEPLDMKKALGAWARARRVWSECSGEPLI